MTVFNEKMSDPDSSARLEEMIQRMSKETGMSEGRVRRVLGVQNSQFWKSKTVIREVMDEIPFV